MEKLSIEERETIEGPIGIKIIFALPRPKTSAFDLSPDKIIFLFFFNFYYKQADLLKAQAEESNNIQRFKKKKKKRT